MSSQKTAEYKPTPPHNQRDKLTAAISKKQRRELSTLLPMHGALHVTLEWLMIVGAAWLCHHHWTWFVFSR